MFEQDAIYRNVSWSNVLRSYISDYIASLPNCEVKYYWVQLVLQWGSCGNLGYLRASMFYFFFPLLTVFMGFRAIFLSQCLTIIPK